MWGYEKYVFSEQKLSEAQKETFLPPVGIEWLWCTTRNLPDILINVLFCNLVPSQETSVPGVYHSNAAIFSMGKTEGSDTSPKQMNKKGKVFVQS